MVNHFEASSKVNYLSFVSITMRLVILLLDVQRRRTTKVLTSTKEEEMKIEKITKTKERSFSILLKRKQKMNLMNIMMKWCMLQ
jgi:acid phosphatase class B